MTFNSLPFLILCLFFFPIWSMLGSKSYVRYIFLIGVSFIFYSFWNWHYLILLIASGLIDWIAAIGIEKYPSHRRSFLTLTLFLNLSILGVFKYSAFMIATAFGLGIPFSDAPLKRLILSLKMSTIAPPPGLSFYTLQSMSYTIDVAAGRIRACINPLKYFSFLVMFPQLIAGPIVRASALLPQLNRWNAPCRQKVWKGIKLISLGLFKKMVIADNLAFAVNLAFGQKVFPASGLYWWIVISMFSFQIYYDFCGYSDIARGLGKCMGYEFMLNFNFPYHATSLRSFWTRWHISLSTWLRDYVYIPLSLATSGKNVNEAFKNHVCLIATMILSGFWHGAHWAFIYWGIYHGLFMTIERQTNWPEYLQKFKWGSIVSRGLTLILVWTGWVLFRANTLEQGISIIKPMFSSQIFLPINLSSIDAIGLLALIVAIGYEYLGPMLVSIRKIRLMLRSPALEPFVFGMIIYGCILLRGPGQTFIYFRF